MTTDHAPTTPRRRLPMAATIGGGVLLAAATTFGVVQAQQDAEPRPAGYEQVWASRPVALAPFADATSVLVDMELDGADLYPVGIVDGSEVAVGSSRRHGLCMVLTDPATEVVAAGCGSVARVEAGGLGLAVTTPRGPIGEIYLVPDGVADRPAQGVERLGPNLVRVDRDAYDPPRQSSADAGGFEIELLPTLGDDEEAAR